MKIDIIVVYIQRYERGHEVDFVPPITGIHLAAITPPGHDVRVIHQQVEPVRFDTDADLVALSFFSGFAPEAYRLAAEFRRRGKIVVGGGPHATFSPDEALRYCDAVVVGEAESVWPRLLEDVEAGRLQPRYDGAPASMRDLRRALLRGLRFPIIATSAPSPKGLRSSKASLAHASRPMLPSKSRQRSMLNRVNLSARSLHPRLPRCRR